jgi:hypothetical protein
MGEFAAKFRPEVDLDEFERRLRAAAPAPQPRAEGSDPLAELARLVGGDSSRKEDPFEALFRAQTAISDLRGAQRAQEPPLTPPPAQPGAANFDHYSLREPYFEQGQAQEPHPHGHEAQAYPAQDYAAQAYAAQHDQAEAYHAEDQAYGQQAYRESEPAWAPEEQHAQPGWPAAFEEPAAAPAPARRSKVMMGMGAILALGVVAIAGTLAFRGKSANHDVVTIQADSDPAKVKPTASDNAENPAGQSLFDRKNNGNVSKVVGSAEQPADLGATVKNARVVGAASGVETPAPPAPAGAAPAQPAQEGLFPAPKKVKTVSVRADGSVIAGQDAAPPVARTLPTMAAGGAPGGVAPTTSAATAVAPKTPAAKTAERATSTNEAALKAPTRPQAEKPAVKEAAVKETAGEGGGFAVQLAGTPSEAEAKAAVSSYAAKYASALGGHRPSFVQAKVGDKTVYRVRVGHLTEDGAKSMCSAIKAQGGACFVAKN